MTIAFLAGHAFNYGLYWGANRILDAGGFGLFYASVLAISVAMSPMLAVTLVLARRFAEIGGKLGRQQAEAMTWRVVSLCMRAVPFAAAAGILLAAAMPWFGIQGWQIALLMPVTVLVLVVVEIIRASLQGMLLFVRASALWVAGTGIECLLSLAALYLFRSVWTGIAGLLIGGILAAAVCLPRYAPSAHQRASAPEPAMALHLRREIPMIVGYSLFILLSNVDIVAAYCLLSHQELGVYAASALLPKAIITATFAVAQVVLPVISDQRAGGLSFRLSAIKGIVMVAAAAGLAAGLLWLAMPLVQRTPFAIRGLDLRVMSALIVAAVALSIVRVLVVIEVALERYALGFAQVGALVLFASFCVSGHANAPRIAALYAITSGAFLLFGAGIMVIWWLAPVGRFFSAPARSRTGNPGQER